MVERLDAQVQRVRDGMVIEAISWRILETKQESRRSQFNKMADLILNIR